jgi:hypothetical protein
MYSIRAYLRLMDLLLGRVEVVAKVEAVRESEAT